MTDTFSTAVTNAPADTQHRYHVAEFGNTTSIQTWLNAHPNYRFISMTPISVTNHFSKETETTVWCVFEQRDSA